MATPIEMAGTSESLSNPQRSLLKDWTGALFDYAVKNGHSRLVKFLLDKKEISNHQINEAFFTVKDKDTIAALGSRFPIEAIFAAERMFNYGESLAITGKIFDGFSKSEIQALASHPKVMDHLASRATLKTDWEMMITIGEINPNKGLDLFMDTLGFDFLEADKLKSRAEYLRRYLDMIWAKQEVIKGFSERVALGMIQASIKNEVQVLKALLSKDWFSLSGIQISEYMMLSPSANANFIQRFLSYANKERNYWILRCMDNAAYLQKIEVGEYLKALILEENIVNEDKFLVERIAESLVLKRDWDSLVKMAEYAPESTFIIFLTKCKNSLIITEYLPKFMMLKKLQPEFVTQTLSTSDALDAVDLSVLKGYLPEDQIKAMQDKKDKLDEFKCQLCLDDPIQCYFTCRKAKKYGHGACESCYSMIKKSDQPACPWCREPIKKMWWKMQPWY